jgi:hypothetical protein
MVKVPLERTGLGLRGVWESVMDASEVMVELGVLFEIGAGRDR